MKIFTSAQIRQADAQTIAREPVTPLKLMERAADACAKWLINNAVDDDVFHIFCGSGNNGGDGLAIARMLSHEGYKVNVFAEKPSATSAEGFKINYQRLAEYPDITLHTFSNVKSLTFTQDSVIVDALFGTGLNRTITGECADLIIFLNSLICRKIAIDIPSGLFSDSHPQSDSAIFAADHTLSFQFYKKAFLHPETGKYCGKIHILHIGLDAEFISEEPSIQFIIDDYLIRSLYKPRPDFANKGDFGAATIVAGSYGKMGAAVLATKAALRTGSGLTYSLVPRCGYVVIQATCPEAMTITSDEDAISDIAPPKGSVVGIGPGMGTGSNTQIAFEAFLQSVTEPVVLDADALNILSLKPVLLKNMPKNSILTPHPKEFSRLFGKSENSYERLDLAIEKASELGVFIVLKDHRTQVITPDRRVFYNVTGNSGMAKGGSGDVLLGIITSLLAQKYSPEEAAVFGVWLHGKAGDFGANKHSKEAMLPSDLIDQLGSVFQCLNDIT